MVFKTKYSFNIKQDTSLAAEKQWVVDVLRLPSTVAATPTAPSNTKGPMGSSGSASAMYTHGDGTSTGYASMLDAIQRALLFAKNDLSLNG